MSLSLDKPGQLLCFPDYVGGHHQKRDASHRHMANPPDTGTQYPRQPGQLLYFPDYGWASSIRRDASNKDYLIVLIRFTGTRQRRPTASALKFTIIILPANLFRTSDENCRLSVWH
ncbi:hypothetical protein CEXT_362341 [Caerostris extrusa]|uniref:Uncharacterized protein n=1 Tax=Caerostris extrusa TaxID=172846 RepID=A0AAV4QMA5_CAEEX|nr:hypothetical protein CEXT_362341 [Caerostris extrusa]